MQFHYVCSISVLSAIMLAIESGAGITLMHRTIARESTAYKVYTPQPAMSYEHYLCMRKGAEITPKLRRVLKVLWGVDI